METCPCGSGKTYADCCDIFISGKQLPAALDLLMRSRYTAYTRLKREYIAHTMLGPAAKNFNASEAESWAKQIQWLGLDVIETTSSDLVGFVEFIAHYSYQEKKYSLHEISEFHFKQDRWYYFDGKTP